MLDDALWSGARATPGCARCGPGPTCCAPSWRRPRRSCAALVEERPADDWARHALGRSLERQSRLAEALPHLRLAAAMSGDPEHELAVLRVERRLAETGERSYDDLT